MILCYLKYFWPTTVIFILLISTGCVSIEIIDYLSNVVSYWKNNDIRSEVQFDDKDYFALMVSAFSGKDAKVIGNVNSVMKSKKSIEIIMPFLIGEKLNEYEDCLSQMIKPLLTQDKYKSLISNFKSHLNKIFSELQSKSAETIDTVESVNTEQKEINYVFNECNFKDSSDCFEYLKSLLIVLNELDLCGIQMKPDTNTKGNVEVLKEESIKLGRKYQKIGNMNSWLELWQKMSNFQVEKSIGGLIEELMLCVRLMNIHDLGYLDKAKKQLKNDIQNAKHNYNDLDTILRGNWEGLKDVSNQIKIKSDELKAKGQILQSDNLLLDKVNEIKVNMRKLEDEIRKLEDEINQTKKAELDVIEKYEGYLKACSNISNYSNKEHIDNSFAELNKECYLSLIRLVSDYIFDEKNSLKYLKFIELNESGCYKVKLDLINKFCKHIFTSLETFSVIQIIKDLATDDGNIYSYVDNELFDDYFNKIGNNEYKFLLKMCKSMQEYGKENSFMQDFNGSAKIVDLKNHELRNHFYKFMTKTQDKCNFHSAFEIFKGMSEVRGTFNFEDNDYNCMQILFFCFWDVDKVRKIIDTLIANNKYENNKFIDALKSFVFGKELIFKAKDDVETFEKIFEKIKTIESKKLYCKCKLNAPVLKKLNDFYNNKFSSINPLKKWAVNTFLKNGNLVKGNGNLPQNMSIDNGDNRITDDIYKIEDIDLKKKLQDFRDKYVFLKLIVDDKSYLWFMVSYLASPVIWLILIVIGFGVFNMIPDFNKIALELAPLLNSNVKYINRNLFLDFSKYISDFHQIVFIVLLFVSWFLFSVYRYVRYFRIGFGSIEKLIIHMTSAFLFVCLMYSQKDVINIQPTEMMIDFSKRNHVVRSKFDNVVKYYEDNIASSKYNKWGFVIFFVFIVVYVLYSILTVDLLPVIVLFNSINGGWIGDEISHSDLSFSSSLFKNISMRGAFFNEVSIKEKLRKVIEEKYSFEIELKTDCSEGIDEDSVNEDIINNVFKGVGEFKWVVIVVNVVFQLFTFIFVFFLSFMFCSLGSSIKFFVLNFDDLTFILKNPKDMALMKSIDNIKSIGLTIKEFKLLDIDDKQFEGDRRKFILRFKNAMFSGDTDQMNELLNFCEYEDLKELLTNRLNEDKSVLLRDIDFKFVGNEVYIIEGDYQYRMNVNMVELYGKYGSGKSTMQDMLSGDRKCIGAKINDMLTYYMDPSSRTLLSYFSSSYTSYLDTVSVFDNLKNANSHFSRDTSVFADIGIPKYSEQLDFNYSDIFMSMGQRCRMDFVYFFSQLDENIAKGRKGFIAFMDEPFGALDSVSVDLTWKVMQKYSEDYGVVFFVVDHSGFAQSKAQLRFVIQDKTLKFFVDDGFELKDLTFDEEGVAEYNDMKIYRTHVNNVKYKG